MQQGGKAVCSAPIHSGYTQQHGKAHVQHTSQELGVACQRRLMYFLAPAYAHTEAALSIASHSLGINWEIKWQTIAPGGFVAFMM